MSRLVSAAFLTAALIIMGCGPESPDSSDPEPNATEPSGNEAAKPSGSAPESGVTFDNPKAVFDAFAKASKANDWGNAIRLLSKESQSMMAAGLVLSASFMTFDDKAKDESLNKLLEKHGIDLDFEPGPGDENAGPESLVKSVKDLPALVAELSDWMSKNGDSSDSGFTDLGELSELKLDGDKATATVDSDTGKRPVEFRKVAGSWLVHLPEPKRGGGELASEPPEDDGTPGLGSLWIDDQAFKLRQATAYRSKFFDDPCIVVQLTARELSPMQLEKLKKLLAEGKDEEFFVTGPNIKLTLDESGKVLHLFAWAENLSINGGQGTEATFELKGNRVIGKAVLAEPKEIFDSTYRFEVEFDTELVSAE